MHPIRFHVHDTVTLLEKENITGDFRSGVGLEGRIRQADRPDEVGTLGQIFPHGGAFLVLVPFEVMKAITPPGRTLSSVFPRK